MGLTVAYLRAEYVLQRGFKADEQEKLSVRHELAADRLEPKQMDAPVAALRIHQRCLGSGCQPHSWASRCCPAALAVSTTARFKAAAAPALKSISTDP